MTARGRWFGAAVLTALIAVALGACAPVQRPVSTAPAAQVTQAVAPAAAPAPATAALSDLQLTFEQAVVALPVGGGQALVTRMGDLRRTPPKPVRPLATVVYMHGCTGVGSLGIIQAMAEAGFAVIAPDSMARRFRPLQCDVRTGQGGFNLFVYDMRAEELSYALSEMRKLPWIDHNNLFLVGGSEGGVTAALYRGDDFRARVIAAWTCHGAPIVAGLSAPLSEPVLAVVSADDPWYHNASVYGQDGDCGAYMGGRPRSRSIILPRGSGHDVFEDPAGQRMILDFLTSNYTG